MHCVEISKMQMANVLILKIGIIIGYITTGIIINNTSYIYSWRLSVVLQGICEIPGMIIIFLTPNKDIDVLCNLILLININK